MAMQLLIRHKIVVHKVDHKANVLKMQTADCSLSEDTDLQTLSFNYH